MFRIFSVLALVHVGNGYPTHSGSCDASASVSASMANTNVQNPPQFSLSISPTQYVLGAAHTITISGPTTFRGLLLYVSDGTNTRLGSFTTAANTQYLTAPTLACPGGSQATLTHTSAAASNRFTASQTFTWTAPLSVSGNLTVRGIAYVSRTFHILTPLTVLRAAGQTNAPTTTGAATTTMAATTTTAANSGSCPSGQVLSAGGTVGGGIDVSLSANCSAQTLTVRLTGPSDRWFGVVFGPMMAPYDAIIYTTGTSGGDPAGLYDYFLGARSVGPSGVRKDTQDWTENSRQTAGGRITLDYSRPWQTSDTTEDLQFTSGNLIIEMRWAHGMMASAMLANHGSGNRGQTVHKFDLYSGSVGSTEAAIPSANIIHAILMFIGWGLVAPFGIWASKNRALLAEYDKDVPCWWAVHRAAMPLALILMIAGIIQAIIMTVASGSGHFNALHDIIGFIAIILAVLQPANAFFRPHPPKEGEEKSQNRRIWEIVHKVSGNLAFVLALFAMLSGSALIGVQALLIIWSIYIVLLAVAFAVGYFYANQKAEGETAGGPGAKCLRIFCGI